MENGTEGSGFSMKNISNKIKLLKMFYKENLKLYQNLTISGTAIRSQ